MLVVSHGGFIHAFFELLLGDPGQPMVNNCSITRVALTPSAVGGRGGCDARVIEANGVAHLGLAMSESAW